MNNAPAQQTKSHAKDLFILQSVVELLNSEDLDIVLRLAWQMIDFKSQDTILHLAAQGASPSNRQQQKQIQCLISQVSTLESSVKAMACFPLELRDGYKARPEIGIFADIIYPVRVTVLVAGLMASMAFLVLGLIAWSYGAE